MNWEWNTKLRRYRNTDTGRLISGKTVVELRDRFVEARAATITGLADDLANDYLGLDEWLQEMRVEVKALTVGEYTFGRGGKNALTEADYARITELVAAQYQYLDRFATQIGLGMLSGDQIRARSALYARAGIAAHGNGSARAWGFELEQYPGDGQTECLMNCKCHLEIKETKTSWEVRWIIDARAEHCDDCKRLAREWSPLVIPKESEEAA